MLELCGAAGVFAVAGCLGSDPETDDSPEDESEDTDDESDEPEGGRLTVQVMTDSGEPIEAATAWISGGDLDEEEQQTDGNGEAVYEGLEEDTYEIEVETEELGSESGTALVREGSNVTRPFSFEENDD